MILKIKIYKMLEMIVLIGVSYAGRGAECPTDHFAPLPDSGRWVNGKTDKNVNNDEIVSKMFLNCL